MRVITPFVAIHKAFNPSSAKVAPIPDGRAAPQKVPFAAEQDLLGFGASPVAAPPASGVPPSATTDLASMFTANVTVSAPTPTPTPGNPFVDPAVSHVPAPSTPVSYVASNSVAGASVVTSPPVISGTQTQLSQAPAQPHYGHSAPGAVLPQTVHVAQSQQYPPSHGYPASSQSPAAFPVGPPQYQVQTHPPHHVQAQVSLPQYQQPQGANQMAHPTYLQQHQQHPPPYAYQPQQQGHAQAPQQAPKPNISQFDPFK